MSNDKKDQEIIVVNPPSRESIGQSSDSTPTLPYSHGQAVLPTSTSISSITSSPVSAPRMLLLKTFPWFPPLQALFIILHCSLLQYLSLNLLLIVALFFLLHWVPLYMATPFLLFILIQPLYLVLTP